MKKSKNKGYQACKKTGKNDQKKKKKKELQKEKYGQGGWQTFCQGKNHV